MPTTKYNVESHQLVSTWTVKDGKVVSGPDTVYFAFNTDIKLPTDAKYIKVKFYCTVDGRAGFKTIKFGNTTIRKDSVTVSVQNVKVTTKNVSVTCTCKALAKKGADYQGEQSATLNVEDVCFEVTWTGSQLPSKTAEQALKTFQREPGLFPNKGSNVFIYDKTVEEFLIFDGVIKVQLSNQVSIQDDTSNQKKKANYVNNAKDDADEITLQVMESNVYTNSSKFEGKSGTAQADETTASRAAATYGYLYSLKQARRKVDVYTRLKLFQDFVIKSISVSLDENNTDGWSGSIVLHEYIASTKKTTSSLGGTEQPYNPLVGLLGENAIPQF